MGAFVGAGKVRNSVAPRRMFWKRNSMSRENPRSQCKESELRAQYVLPESDKTLKRVEIFGKGTINTEGSGGTRGKWVREGKKLEGWSRGFPS